MLAQQNRSDVCWFGFLKHATGATQLGSDVCWLSEEICASQQFAQCLGKARISRTLGTVSFPCHPSPQALLRHTLVRCGRHVVFPLITDSQSLTRTPVALPWPTHREIVASALGKLLLHPVPSILK